MKNPIEKACMMALSVAVQRSGKKDPATQLSIDEAVNCTLEMIREDSANVRGILVLAVSDDVQDGLAGIRLFFQAAGSSNVLSTLSDVGGVLLELADAKRRVAKSGDDPVVDAARELTSNTVLTVEETKEKYAVPPGIVPS